MSRKLSDSKWTKVLRRIERDIKRAATDEAKAEVRKRYREQTKVIFVRTYTVQAHLRPVRPRRPKRQQAVVLTLVPGTEQKEQKS